MTKTRRAEADDVAIGARVRRARRESEMSQEKLAGLLGITFQQVQKYENGKNRLSGARLVAVARALDRPIEYFFQDVFAPAWNRAERADVVRLACSAAGMRLVSAALSLADAGRGEALALLVATAEQLAAAAKAAQEVA